MPQNPPFWRPGVHAARRPYLLARGRVAAAVRAYFADRGFVEVETATLQVSPGNETHLHAFATDLIGPGNERRGLYLRTSPEFAAKKLLAAGETRIFVFVCVFCFCVRGALFFFVFSLLVWPCSVRFPAAWATAAASRRRRQRSRSLPGPTIPGATSSAAFSPTRSNRVWARAAAPRTSMNIPCRRRRWRGQSPAATRSPR